MRKKMLFLALALVAVASSLSTVRAEADGSYACPICTTYADGSQCCVSCVCTVHGHFTIVACAQNACAPAI
jgi:hypothetical protein